MMGQRQARREMAVRQAHHHTHLPCPMCHALGSTYLVGREGGWTALWRCLYCSHSFIGPQPFSADVIAAYVRAGGQIGDGTDGEE